MGQVCTTCNQSDRPLEKAAEMDHTECLKILVEGASVNKISQAFMIAVENSGFISANFLLDTGINVNYQSNNRCETPLMFATLRGQLRLMQKLLEAGANVNAINDKGQAAVHLAKTKGCVDLLIHAGAYVNLKDKEGRTPLYCMVEEGNIDCSLSLISAGADVNKACCEGKTVLIRAVSLGNLELVEVLLKKGADIDAFDSRKCNALLYAGLKGNTAILHLLLKAEADVHATHSEKRRSSLIAAAHMGHEECITILLDEGADVNGLNFNNQSPLMHAALSNKRECVKLLLQAGAKVRTKSNNGFGTLPLYVVKNILWRNSDVDTGMISVLHAAGERKEEASDEVVKQLRRTAYPWNFLNMTNEECLNVSRKYLRDDEPTYLKRICRRAIREHLLQISRVNLFVRVPHMCLPSILREYLLFHVSLQ